MSGMRAGDGNVRYVPHNGGDVNHMLPLRLKMVKKKVLISHSNMTCHVWMTAGCAVQRRHSQYTRDVEVSIVLCHFFVHLISSRVDQQKQPVGWEWVCINKCCAAYSDGCCEWNSRSRDITPPIIFVMTVPVARLFDVGFLDETTPSPPKDDGYRNSYKI